MHRLHCLLLLLGAISAIGYSTGSHASECRCAHCGRPGACQKICRLVCDEKKVQITCYGCKAEDFCVPCPSTPGCPHCEDVCLFCNDKATDVCSKPRRFLWLEWHPGTAQVYTRKKLMRRVVTQKIPSYKWVIEDLCADCQNQCAVTEVVPGTEIPPAPKVASGTKVFQPTRATILPASREEQR